MPYKKPIRIGEALQEVIDRMGIREQIDEAAVVAAWMDLAGPRINRVTRHVWFEQRVLHVQITSAVWRQELHFHRAEWRERLNTQLGKHLVHEIRFR